MPRVSDFKRANGGAAAVEFALIAPLFFLLLLTLVAFAIYLTAANSLQQLTANAARTAIAGISSDERSQLVQNFINNSTINNAFLSKDKLTITVATDPTNANQFTVSATYDASALPIWNLYTFAMPDPTIRRFSTIRIGGT